MEQFGSPGAEVKVEQTTGSAGRFVVLTTDDPVVPLPEDVGWCGATAALDRRDVEALRDHLTDVLERW